MAANYGGGGSGDSVDSAHKQVELNELASVEVH